MQGFLNLNKPTGLTSHDCVARVRRMMRLKRVGHGGTLDPAATGVLPIALGSSTRLLQFLQQDKAYQATIKLGITTTTDDLEGEVITAKPVSPLRLEEIKQALKLFEGTIQQVPPSYSAIQVQGKRLYDLARAGEKVEVPARTVEVFKIEILAWQPDDFPTLDIAIFCGSGTYIRAIARDLGIALQTGGTLERLIRTFSSGFDLADSLSLEELDTQLQQNTFVPIPPAKVLQHLDAVSLATAAAEKWCQGQRIVWNDTTASLSIDSPLQVYQDERFLGIGYLVNSDGVLMLVPQIVLGNG